MQLFTVEFNRDVPMVVTAEVVKETPLFYFITPPEGRYKYAFGFSKRVDKGKYATSEREAIEKYIARRERAKGDAQAVVTQATVQIEAACSLLEALGSSQAANAVAGLVE